MKKLFALMAICGVTLSLTGCLGKKADDNADKGDKKPAAEASTDKPADDAAASDDTAS